MPAHESSQESTSLEARIFNFHVLCIMPVWHMTWLWANLFGRSVQSKRELGRNCAKWSWRKILLTANQKKWMGCGRKKWLCSSVWAVDTFSHTQYSIIEDYCVHYYENHLCIVTTFV